MLKSENLLKKIRDSHRLTSIEERFELKEKIFKDFGEGILKKDIANKYNLSIERITKILNNSCWKNIEIPPELLKFGTFKINQMSDEKALNIIKYYCENDCTKNDICKIFKENSSKIISLLTRKTFLHLDISKYKKTLDKKVKIDIKYRSLNNDDIPIILNYHNEGKSDTQISKIFGCSRRTINNLINGKTYKNARK